MNLEHLPIAVIGAGPIGLSAAAHLLGRGETPLVLEAGANVGSSIREWAHVSMFSPWEFCMDREAVALLTASGWQPPPERCDPYWAGAHRTLSRTTRGITGLASTHPIRRARHRRDAQGLR
jgi:cation diffusion facilitator CzcD-associated flavoprotein CzcO